MGEDTLDLIFSSPEKFEGKLAKIKCVGVGGGGGNAINHMVEAGIDNVDFIAINTDAQDLRRNRAPYLVQVGEKITQGLGVGGDPEKGKKAAEESLEHLKNIVSDTDLLFITAGMGGGTGTGVAPILAKVAKQTYGDNILVVGVVTRPFKFEGVIRGENADKGIKDLQEWVDSMIVVSNDRLFETIDSKTTTDDAYKMVDEVLLQAVKGVSEVILKPGQVNIDYNDLKSIMLKSGRALIGIGQAMGAKRHLEAIKQALNSPLLENADITGAKGFIVFFSGQNHLAMSEVNEVMAILSQYASASSKPKIMFGHMQDPNLPEGFFKVTVIATGFDKDCVPNISRTTRLSLINKASSPRDAVRNTPLPHVPSRLGGGRSARSSELYGSRSDFMLIPAYIRRRKEGK